MRRVTERSGAMRGKSLGGTRIEFLVDYAPARIG